MRRLMALAAFAALTSPAAAQQPRPQGQPRVPAQAQPAAPQPPAPPPIFPCRTPEEVCFLGIVTGNNQIAVVFTNAPQAESIGDKPVDVVAGEAPGTPVDLAPHLGRVVMLTGTFDAKAGLTKAEVVEVASPLVSLTVKAQLAVEEPQAGPSAQRGGKAPAQARPKR
jgi:hypothetical protein